MSKKKLMGKMKGKQLDRCISSQMEVGENLFLLCTPSGRVIFVSGELKLLLGFDLTGRSLNDFLEDEIAAKLVALAANGVEYSFDCVVAHKGLHGEMELNGKGMTIVFRQLNPQGEDVLDDRLARLLSRESNTALASAFATVELLKRELESNEKAMDYVALLSQTLFKLIRLNQNMMDCANYQNGRLSLKLEEGDLNSYLRELLEEVQTLFKTTPIQFSGSFEDKAIICWFDRERIGRVMHNLIANAIKSRSVEGLAIRLMVSDRDDSAMITLSDNGNGIPSGVLGKVFSKYNGTDSSDPQTMGGAGFGLSVVKAFVEMHKGSLMITNRPAGGTSVRIILPKNTDPNTAQFHTYRPLYSGGYRPVLIELSGVLPKEAYL